MNTYKHLFVVMVLALATTGCGAKGYLTASKSYRSYSQGSSDRKPQSGQTECNIIHANYFDALIKRPQISPGIFNTNDVTIRIKRLDATFYTMATNSIQFFKVNGSNPSETDTMLITLEIPNRPSYQVLTAQILQALPPTGITTIPDITISGFEDTKWSELRVVLNTSGGQASGLALVPLFDADPLAYKLGVGASLPQLLPLHPFYDKLQRNELLPSFLDEARRLYCF